MIYVVKTVKKEEIATISSFCFVTIGNSCYNNL